MVVVGIGNDYGEDMIKAHFMHYKILNQFLKRNQTAQF